MSDTALLPYYVKKSEHHLCLKKKTILIYTPSSHQNSYARLDVLSFLGIVFGRGL